MNTFGLIQATISHNVKDPHSKALEPDCLFPRIAIMTQLLREGKRIPPFLNGDEGGLESMSKIGEPSAA